ncbi:uncharacterized protein TRIADDRAFT_50830 [Trichoplax adhaerens]|uniref:Uncharacterized protein n=1 Tax=Trichoplax adhaerens TaxID=10228 RepID=B3S7J8_TRIAD|nr:hypothetical protein TRIADDRAFT_50830 [Trichoplax adhaerens]EDV21210.1 hypothetical protein TRIADDRAFT_50830 [Trichoplax adhaerens]|eukprot:XP_002116177.1 hypothetical protein TRIADDRAFT_50830 [Trichoplax adhaerens]
MIQSWVKVTITLCLYGFFKEMKPSEPFLTPFLKGLSNNLTENDLEQIYPVWTYSYLGMLAIALLVTDLARYKPIIIIEALAYLATRIILLAGHSVPIMQLMQFAYGIATATEIAYYAYIYAAVSSQHYQKVTSYTRMAVLCGRSSAGFIGQLLVSLHVANLYALNVIATCSVCIALVLAVLLPKIHPNDLQSNQDPPLMVSINNRALETESRHDNSHQQHQDSKVDNRVNTAMFSQRWKQQITHFTCTLTNQIAYIYSNHCILRWSLWWALATCGELLVGNYVENLWDVIYPARYHNEDVYNGLVLAVATLLGAGAALALAYVKFDWGFFGELTAGIVSAIDGVLLLIMALTNQIWLCYGCYVIFRTSYALLITIASLQIVNEIKRNCYGLVFGINMFLALSLQTILQAVIQGYKVHVVHQFYTYSAYFGLLGLAFTAVGAYKIESSSHNTH